MILKDVLKLRGINYWHLANAMGWNFLGSGAVLMATPYFLEKNPTAAVVFQFLLMFGVFLVPLTAGFLFGRLAADNRGLTYGVFGSFVSIALCLFLVFPGNGILGAMLGIIALAGGLNGGLLSHKKTKRNE